MNWHEISWSLKWQWFIIIWPWPEMMWSFCTWVYPTKASRTSTSLLRSNVSTTECVSWVSLLQVVRKNRLSMPFLMWLCFLSSSMANGTVGEKGNTQKVVRTVSWSFAQGIQRSQCHRLWYGRESQAIYHYPWCRTSNQAYTRWNWKRFPLASIDGRKLLRGWNDAVFVHHHVKKSDTEATFSGGNWSNKKHGTIR